MCNVCIIIILELMISKNLKLETVLEASVGVPFILKITTFCTNYIFIYTH